ncbi:hypothetical protein [Cerasicoccus arenae]|uniref:Uncharacterized protein n=1 Tax=Cerasicoccus arenae TaxID=424488 RepID=A0A8J3GCP0_9BACT|nr:hypothetical protein [Cerasicoccus arenae]MBK1856948.1 hypothetical protein [Cerasicoccus arenae]GHB89991.1 hypothetical protein GCM10007047_00720 [Cerasicoccus arenae]
MTFPRASIILSTCLLTMLSTVLLNAQGEPRPEEVTPVGPGYITKGYKTMVNGQVVQTTDGRNFELNTIPAPTSAPASPPPSSAPVGNWPQVVTIIDGVVVDPDTKQPVTNLPPEIELIPLGLRKTSTDIIGPEGEVTTSESVAPFFRVIAKNPPATPAPPVTIPVGGPDFSSLMASQETADAEPEITEEASPEEKDSGGGFFDFLFGSDEPEEGKVVIDLERPLSEAEVAALQNDPKFQDFLRKRSNTTRNFYSSKGRSVSRNETPAPPRTITIEEFKPEEWVEEGPTPPTPNIAIGKLVSVDEQRQIAVCWLQTRYIHANRPMVTRNYELQTTGVLLPSGEQDGRSAGFWIAQGSPSPGDEVIVPGPAYENLVSPWMKKR